MKWRKIKKTQREWKGEKEVKIQKEEGEERKT